MKGHEDGFTLIELLIYSLVFSAFALTFVYFLTTFFRVSNYQSNSGELTNQANFIVQTIERQIAGASILTVNDTGNDEVDDTLGQPHTKLVMKNHAETTADASDSTSPITISTSTVSASQTDIVMKQGNQATTTLNNASITVTSLSFTKISTPPGKDVVLVNMGLKYQNGPAAERISRQFAFGVGKTSDAIFDNTVSSSIDNAFDIGTTGSKWRSFFVATTSVDGKVTWTSGGTATVNNSISFLRTGFLSVAIRVLAANEKLLITMTSSTAPGFPELTGVNDSTKVLMTPLRNTAVPTNEIVLVTARGKTPDTVEFEVKNVSSTAASAAETRNFSYLMIR